MLNKFNDTCIDDNKYVGVQPNKMKLINSHGIG